MLPLDFICDPAVSPVDDTSEHDAELERQLAVLCDEGCPHCDDD